jgi:hypothetical protein
LICRKDFLGCLILQELRMSCISPTDEEHDTN